jgi:phosphoenolpyruvate synthase/pyruvate phosphate dikinase
MVDPAFQEVHLTRIEKPADEQVNRPVWSIQRIKLEEPETINVPILGLSNLRMSDRYRYGTKAANLGELAHILSHGSERLTGFYKIKRPPRPNLLSYLAVSLGLSEGAPATEISKAASDYIRANVNVPRGIALPFSLQQEFLESSPRIQQAIGKLKMALELSAREVDSLCLSLQAMIRGTRVPDRIRNLIDDHIADHLAGVSSFVIRSSSNAEDLEGFSAAGIYESINHVTSSENIFQSIKDVWASLVSPRSVRLRQEVGISLDDCYMGVIVQEEIPSDMGGVLVTTNPMNRGGDFRNVYINVSLMADAAQRVVTGSESPNQYLYNTVEGGGRTLSIGDGGVDLSLEQKNKLQTLAICGRLLQSHFSPDYTFSTPMDIEWIAGEGNLYLLQLRPYKK